MSENKNKQEENIIEGTDWLDETGSLPKVEADWLDETGSLPKVEADWLDETGSLPKAGLEKESAQVKQEKPNEESEKEEQGIENTCGESTRGEQEKSEEEGKQKEAEKESTQEEQEKPDVKKKWDKTKLLWSTIVVAAAAVAVVVLIVSVNYLSGIKAVQAQMLEIQDVGAKIADLDLDESSTFRVIADARVQEEKEEKAQQEKAEQKERKEAEREQKLDEAEGSVVLEMDLSTIQSDLKVKIRDSVTKSLIGDVPFRILVKAPSGKTLEYEDQDKDGIIYETGLASGKYQVTLEQLIDLDEIKETAEEDGEDYHENTDYIKYSKFTISDEPQSISITDKIAYEVVDVADEIKSASEINVAQEDTAHNDTAVEGTIQDTVALVDSSVTEIADSSSTGVSGAVAGTDSAAAGQADTGAAAGAGTGTSAGTEETAALADESGAAASATASTDSGTAAGASGQPDSAEAAAAGETAAADESAAKETSSGSDTGAAGEQTAPEVTYIYTGWQTIDGKTYYYDVNGNYVTGTQVIAGITYIFGDDGVLNTAASRTGIDVSQWNGTVNWQTVAASGISFAIVRCGYRGSTQGMLVLDPMVGTNVMGAKNAGLRVGLYFFSQAVNEAEAVEEASMAVQIANTYGISMPIFLDVESSGGRGDAVSVSQRTANIVAFCQTVTNAGYTAGVYANSSWLTEKINAAALTSYQIWLAQYAALPTYSATAYNIWQYTSTGHVNGINGDVDLNIQY